MSRLVLVTLLVGALSGIHGCGRGSDHGLDGVVLIVVDTLRADHLGFMGADGARTPHLDALAARGRVYTDAMTPVPVTLPAVASILSATTPLVHGVRDNEGFVLGEELELLPEVFARAGWRTGAVVGAAVLASDRGSDRGFDDYDDDFGADAFPVYREDLRPMQERMRTTRRRAGAVTDRALGWIDREPGRPFFLMIHYFDVHSPYDPPPRFTGNGRSGFYPGAVSATDASIGRLLEALPPRTLVAFVADHGEGLGDHDELEHGFLLYQPTLHVPMLYAGPGVAPGRVDEPVSLIDVAPTLAAACGLPGPRHGQGTALDLTGHQSPPSRSLYAESLRPLISYGWQELRALRRGPRKLIAGRDRVELYDLDRDADEQQDLAHADAATSSLVRALDAEVAGEDAEIVRRRARQRAATDPARSELLRSLGYVGETTAEDEPDSRPHPADELPRWNQRQRDRVSARVAANWIDAGEFAAALSLLDSVLVRMPERADLLFQRSRAHRGLGAHAAATADLEASLRADPLFVPALRVRAQSLVEAGRFGEAVTAFERLLRSIPDDPDGLYNLGVTLSQSGETARAREVLKRFVEAAGPDERAASVRRWLESEPE